MDKHFAGDNQATSVSAMAAHAGQRQFHRGQVVFNSKHVEGRQYLVASGEVLILRNGNMIDIVEKGEYLHPAVWQRATAIAWTDCRLVGMG